MAEPRERPMLFSGHMVRALLEGRKTQTRRAVKIAGIEDAVSGHFYPSVGLASFNRADGRESRPMPCPYGKPGDCLWVRETWKREEYGGQRPAETLYRADMDDESAKRWAPWRPSLHMPRWASRLLLEVTEVRVQRLQDLTEQDAKAEGARYFGNIPLSALSASTSWGPTQAARWSMELPANTDQCLGTARYAFANYVNQLHGGPLWNCRPEPSLWDTNPWVWAVSFRRVEGSR